MPILVVVPDIKELKKFAFSSILPGYTQCLFWRRMGWLIEAPFELPAVPQKPEITLLKTPTRTKNSASSTLRCRISLPPFV